MSKKTGRKYAERLKASEVDKPLLDQFQTGEWRTFPGNIENAISVQVESSLPSPPGPGSAAELTDTFSRGKSWSSTSGRSRPRRGNKAEIC